MLANTKQIRTIIRNALNCNGDTWTDICRDSTMRYVAVRVGWQWDDTRKAQLKRDVENAVFLAGFTNKIKVTQSKCYGRDGGAVYVRVKALLA